MLEELPLPALPGKYLMGCSGLEKSQPKDEGFVPFQTTEGYRGREESIAFITAAEKGGDGCDEGRRL